MAEIARIFGARNPLPSYPERYNIAPTDPVLAVRWNSKTQERSLDAQRWGLVPLWAKALSMCANSITARVESVARMPAFRDASRERRSRVAALAQTQHSCHQPQSSR